MGKIATEQYCASIGGGSGYTNNLCATKSRAQALGCTVNGSYSNNQLVEEDSLIGHYNPYDPPYDPYNGHDYVEIGGLKWATMNIGATSITDTGLYFAWGDTQGYTASQVGSGSGKKYFGLKDYKYYKYGGVMTKYNSTDRKRVLESSDDAARANWGGSWRMPTDDEYWALINAVTTAWTNSYQGSGVAGMICTDKTDSSKVLFFPACGNCYIGSVNYVGSYGDYWSSSLNSSKVQNAYVLSFSNRTVSGGLSVSWQGYIDRSRGLSVRGVIG